MSSIPLLFLAEIKLVGLAFFLLALLGGVGFDSPPPQTFKMLYVQRHFQCIISNKKV